MNIICLILLCHFVFAQGARPFCGVPTPPPSNEIVREFHHESLPLHNVQMVISDENSDAELESVNLKLTKRSLANENLPIWILNREFHRFHRLHEDRNDLIRNNEIMKTMGGFSTYQDPETSSAAVYFHGRREFHGMIDSSISIRGFPVKFVNPHGSTRAKINNHGITKIDNPFSHGPVNAHIKPISLDSDEDSETNARKTYENRVFDAYPEILVVVAWDMVQRITAEEMCDETEMYAAVVSYVISLFNGVDMLFSKIQDTQIQINIAGVIIAKDKESLSFMNECFVHIADEQGFLIRRIDGSCAMNKMNIFLRGQETKITPESYDITVLLTGNQITYLKKSINQDMNEGYTFVKGLSIRQREMYEYIRQTTRKNTAAIITGEGHFESYPVIAHEIGHTLAADHDVLPYLTYSGQCCGSLMKPAGGYCKKCLSWSATTKAIFKSYFSSPNCCVYVNKPGSLLPPGRHQMLTADEQCQCYGYKSTKEFTEIPDNFCQSHLQCKTENDEFYATVIPMYGTPCQSNMVCSEKICQKIEVFGKADSDD